MNEHQIILGNVPSKSNSYKVINMKGHASLAKTRALKEYEDKFYIQCDKYRNANIAGYFELCLKVFYPSERSDLDNSLKIILDCLQRVKAIRNDNRCVKIIAEKYLDKERPRIEFLIKKYDMEDFELIYEDFFFSVYETCIKGTTVRFSHNKITNEIRVSGDDMAKHLGYDSFNELLGTDIGLDAINEWKEKYPDNPVFGGSGSGAMLEKSYLF